MQAADDVDEDAFHGDWHAPGASAVRHDQIEFHDTPIN